MVARDTDPDQTAFRFARAALLEELLQIGEARRIGTLGEAELSPALSRILSEFVIARSREWAKARDPLYACAEPDAEQIGYAEASLGQFAKLEGVDWSKPLKDWSKRDMARLISFGCNLVIAAEEAVLEREPLNDDIPF